MTNRVKAWRAALAVCGLAAAAGIGCDQRSGAAKSVDQATMDLHALSGASPEPATSEASDKTFKKVAGDLSPAVSQGDAGDKATAALLVAQTQAGLGEAAAAEASASERDSLNRITQIQALLSQWRMRSAVAGAAEAYDPAGERADIAKSKQEKDALIAQEQSHRSQVQGQLDDFKTRAKQKMDAAAAKEAEYGKLMQDAVKKTATEAVPIVEQANKAKREGDALRLDGTKLDAQAQSIAPVVTEIDAQISKLTNQKKDLEATDAALAKRLSDSKAEASEARADASKANVELEKQVDALTALRKEQIDPAYDKALGLFQKASSAGQGAAQLAPGAGKGSVGDAQLSIADMHWQKSQGLRSYALLLESLASAEPALPKKSQYAEAAKAARDAAKKEMEDASAAIETAKSAFESGAGRLNPASKEKVENLTKLLETATKVSKEDATGVTPDLLAMAGKGEGAAPAPSGGSDTAAPAGNADASAAAKAAAEAIVNACKSKNWTELAALMNVPESARGAMVSMLQLDEKGARVEAAFKAKFGTSLKDAASSNPMLAGALKKQGFEAAEWSKVQPSDLTATVNGDSGTVNAAGVEHPITLKNVGGKWLLSDPAIEMMGAQAPMLSAMTAPLGKVMDEFAGEVEAGKYPDANTAVSALMAKFTQAMGGLVPPGGGNKGPGGGG